MSNILLSSDEDQTESMASSYCWWRSAEEFINEKGKPQVMDISDLSSLTPRLKVVREMERLALVASEGLDELRHKLMAYQPGHFSLPIGGIKKEDLDIPPTITILLVGLYGSGKSSLVNLMYSVLGRSGLIPFAHTSGESSKFTARILEEHNVLRSTRSGFCVYDTRGLDYDYHRISEGIDEVRGWMVDGVRHCQPCCRPGDQEEELKRGVWSFGSTTETRYTKRAVNYVFVVVNLEEVYNAFESGNLKPLEATKELFHCPYIRKCNESPIILITHGDKLTTEERISSRLKLCEYVGVTETTGAYDIPCLTEQGILPDPVTAFALTEAVYRAVMLSDRSHLPKRKAMDYIWLLLSWIMCCISAFFALLAIVFSKLSHDHKLKV